MKKLAMFFAIASLMVLNINAWAETEETVSYKNQTISSYGGSFFAVQEDGGLWSWSKSAGITENQEGQLGDGTTEDRENPKKILNNVISIDAGIFHTLAVKQDGSLWGWGGNYFGQLGENAEGTQLFPVKIMDHVISASAGQFHTLIVKEDHSLWGCGSNEWGQLGIEDTDGCVVPKKIMEDVKAAVAGSRHSIVLKTDGSVWTFGENSYGQLGDGTQSSHWEPIEIMQNIKEIYAGNNGGFAISEEHILWMWGTIGDAPDDVSYHTPIRFLEDVNCVSPQSGHILAVKTDKSLWAYGFPDIEQEIAFGANKVALPMKLLDGVCYVSGSESVYPRALALTENHELYCIEILRKQPEKGEKPYTLTKVLDGVRLPGAYHLPEGKHYTDLSNQPKETQEAVEALTKAGIVEGTSETEFSPEAAVTRAEAAAMFLRMAGIEESADNGGFSDVSRDQWYYGVAGASKEYGIISGFEDNTFRGDETVTREQMIVLAARMLRKEKGCEIPQDVSQYLRFDDADEISGWAREDIALASREGLIPEQEKQLRPGEPMRRGDAAVILYRLYNQI